MQIGLFEWNPFGKSRIGAAIDREAELPVFLELFLGRAMAFAYENCGVADVREAWNAFRVWLSSELDPSAEDWRLFLFWYIFHWQPSDHPLPCSFEESIAGRAFLTLREETSPRQEAFLRAAASSPLDFYEVYRLQEWDCFYVKSLLLGQEGSFSFRELPPEFTEGDIFFGKVIPLQEDQGVLAAHSAIFTSSAKVPISALRLELIKDRRADFSRNFRTFDSDVFNLYHDLLKGSS